MANTTNTSRRRVLQGTAAVLAAATAIPAVHVAGAFKDKTTQSKRNRIQWWHRFEQTNMAPLMCPGDNVLMKECSRFEGPGVYIWDMGDRHEVSHIGDIGPSMVQVNSGNFKLLEEIPIDEINKRIIGKAKASYRGL